MGREKAPKLTGHQIRLLTGKLPGHRSHCSGWSRWCREYERRRHRAEMKALMNAKAPVVTPGLLQD